MCLLFSTTFVWNISHSKDGWAEYDKNVYCSSLCTMCSSFTKCLQDGCHGSWLLNWESDVLMLVKNFFGAFNEKAMASLQESLLGTKPGFTSTNRKRRERTRNGAIPHHQNQSGFEQNHQQRRLCWLSFGTKRASFWSTTRLEGPLSPVHHTQISYKIILTIH